MELESDCLVSVQAVTIMVPIVSPSGVVIDECHKTLHSLYEVLLFFIELSANVLIELQTVLFDV